MLKIEKLSVRYSDGNQVISNLSFTAREGETVGIVGANGAGKSTLLSAIVGILLPSEGRIEVNGIPVDKRSIKQIREQVGVVFQNPDDQLFLSNVYDDIAFGLRNYGVDEKRIEEKVDRVLEQLDVARLKRGNSHKLSGGEKRIIAIATILVMEPSIILFDEPTSFLDPKTRRKLIELLKSIPVTKLIATHDLDMALELCDRVLVFKDGKIYAEGSAKQILADKDIMEEAGLELPFCLQSIPD